MRFSLSPVDPVDGEEILPLDAAKAHLRVTHGHEDELIGALRDAAIDAVEQYTGKSMLARPHKWRGRFGTRLILGLGPLVAVQAVKYLDTAGAEQTPVVAETLRPGLDGELLPIVGTSWPATADGDGVVEIEFTAGYAATKCPPSLIMAAKLMLGTLYANREAVIVGVTAGELPLGFKQLCRPYRTVRV